MTSRALLWALALGLVAWAAWLWPEVPARIPTHFGPTGEPDAWSDRSLGAWFTLPLIGLGLAALMEGAARLARRPDLRGLNLPNKDAILALPPERRGPVLDRVGAWMRWIGVVSLAGFALIQVGTWAEAHGAGGGGSWRAGS